MNPIVSHQASHESTEPWGDAHPRRGLGYHEIAVAFVKDFPVGETLTAATFDDWAQKRGLLNVPTNAPKRSDAWMAHLHRRHELRYRLNKAGSHPRMIEAAQSFVIETVVNGTYEVRSPQSAVIHSQVQRKLTSLMETKRQQVAYLMQSADWGEIQPQERTLMEELYFDIEAFEKHVNLQADLLGQRFARVESRLRRAIEKGELKPLNGGLGQLLTPPRADQ